MNKTRHKFTQQVQPELAKFLQECEKHKNSADCDLQQYEKWQQLFPNQISVQNESNKVAEIIDLNSVKSSQEPKSQAVSDYLSQINSEIGAVSLKFSIQDSVYAIKESLEIEKGLSESILSELNGFNSLELEQIFTKLSTTLSFEEILHCGEALLCCNDDVVSNFCKYLLIERALIEFCPNLAKVFEKFGLQQANVLKTVILHWILSNLHSNQSCKVLVQYLAQMKLDFQSSVLNDFVFNVKEVENDEQLNLISQLLNNQADFETIGQIIKILSPRADFFAKDKIFGKILLNLIDFLGPNLIKFQNQLKQLIAQHNSIWKSKLNKKFESCFEDSLLFSQTFRE